MFYGGSDARSDTVRPVRQMQTYRAPTNGEDALTTRPYSVVLGPCPGCDEWQLDYTDDVAQEFVQMVPAPGEPFGLRIDMQPWHDVIEDALREHMAECPHLRDLVEAYV